MKSRTKLSARQITRICAAISAGLMLVLGLPACTGGALPTARSTVQDEPSAGRREITVTSTPDPLVFSDETSKSLPVGQNDEMAGACSEALYVEESVASGYLPVSESFWEHCEEDLAKCGKACRRKRSDKAKSECFQECNKAFTRCLQVAGLVKATFNAFDAAWSWIKGHKVEIVGSIVVIGGIAYLVSTGGSGALILIPLGA